MQINPKPSLENFGGKGWHLELLSKFCPVPEFFVLKFDSAGKIDEPAVLREFDRRGFGLVSVRSSATVEDSANASFAGIFESVLNVSRAGLIDAIRQVVGSVKDERVKQYCEMKGIDYSTVEMRVVIQKMVNADVAGVVFTKTCATDTFITIEACLGLGEALVGGKVTPDNYTVDRESFEILERTVGVQKVMLCRDGWMDAPPPAQTAKLSDREIKEIAKVCMRIEKELGFRAADVEFAYEGGKLYVLQARAVTGIEENNFDLFNRLNNAQVWKNLVRRNYPLLWRSLNVDGFTRKKICEYTGIDFFVPSKTDGKSLFRDIPATKETIQLLTNSVGSKLATFDGLADKEYVLVENFLRFCESFRNKSFEKYSNKQLVKILKEYQELYTSVTVFRPVPGMFDAFMLPYMQGELEKIKDVDFKIEYLQPKVDLPFIAEHKSILRIVAEMQKMGLASVDNLPRKIEAMIDAHMTEFDWFLYFQFIGEPMTRQYVLDLIVPLLEIDCAEKLRDMETEYSERNQKVSQIKEQEPRFVEIFDVGQKFMHLRTFRIDMENKGDFYIRHLLFEIAERVGIGYSELLLLTVAEIVGLLDGKIKITDLAEKIAKRREYYVYLVVNDNEIHLFEGNEFAPSEDRPQDITVLSGKVAQRGRITGKVKLVIDNNDIEKVGKGDIIVSPMTAPSMVVAILKCSGIITDEGGIACHAAQISREFKIPCIMGTGNATSVLKDGDLVELIADGMEGIVNKI
jgi:pyruvate,water dikinase